jgi:predicted transcriptional regulator
MQRPALSNTELEVLKVLWEQGPGTVRDLEEILRRRGRRWAYTTVQTLLARLSSKGYVASDKSGVAHVYRAVVTRDRLLRQRLRQLADDLCEGTASPLVLALVEGQRFSPEEIEEFRRLLDELDKKRKR